MYIRIILEFFEKKKQKTKNTNGPDIAFVFTKAQEKNKTTTQNWLSYRPDFIIL